MEVATKEMCMLEPDIGSLYSCRINEHKDFVSMRTPILIYIFKETEINPTQFPHQEAQKKKYNGVMIQRLIYLGYFA